MAKQIKPVVVVIQNQTSDPALYARHFGTPLVKQFVYFHISFVIHQEDSRFPLFRKVGSGKITKQTVN